MAESISEGTLKTWQKKVGDTVAADEEVATIETDKVCTVLPVPSLTSLFFGPPFIVASFSGSYFSVHLVTSELDSVADIKLSV
jgi:hypothetical protein